MCEWAACVLSNVRDNFFFSKGYDKGLSYLIIYYLFFFFFTNTKRTQVSLFKVHVPTKHK